MYYFIKVILHELYDYPKYDIALVELDRPVKWSKYINIICLPNGERPEPGTRCWATGYGTTSFRGSLSADLQQVDLPIVDQSTCVNRYKNKSTEVDPSLMICAGYKEGGKDACQGDSGGPLVCQRCNSCDYYLAGAISFGKGCASPEDYGVYTDIEALEEWISENVEGVNITKGACVKTGQF